MIPMLLVLGSLVPASDSPEMTIAPRPPRAVGASVDVRDLIRPGMTTEEVQRLLGKPSREMAFGFGPAERPAVMGFQEYANAGVRVTHGGWIITEVTHFRPVK
jgi:hypothetical protein